MSDPTPAPQKKSVRREKIARPSAPSVEALASVVREAEAAKAPKAEPVPAAAEAPPEPAPAAAPKPEPAPVTAVAAPVRALPSRAAPPAPRRLAVLVREHGPLAAALAMAVGLGWVCGLATVIHAAPPETPPAPAALVMDLGVSAPMAIRTPQAESGRLAGEMKALSGAMAGLRSGLETARAEQAARLARLETMEGEATARLQQLADRVAALKDGEMQLAAVLARLDRMERAPAVSGIQPASLPAAAVAAQPPVSQPPVTGSLPEARPAERQPQEKAQEKVQEKVQDKAPEPRGTDILSNWHLRGVHRGVALVEGELGLVEVRAGEVIPGVGRVQAIEKRGREWVVVTGRGLITTESW